MLIHGCAISLHGQGVLILGESGSGKSTLCLELIDRGAKLVADDQVLLHVHHNQLYATAPDILAEVIELRGLCPIRLEPERCLSSMSVDVIIRLEAECARVLDPDLKEVLCAIALPLIPVNRKDSALALKLNHYFAAKSEARLVDRLTVASRTFCA